MSVCVWVCIASKEIRKFFKIPLKVERELIWVLGTKLNYSGKP